MIQLGHARIGECAETRVRARRQQREKSVQRSELELRQDERTRAHCEPLDGLRELLHRVTFHQMERRLQRRVEAVQPGRRSETFDFRRGPAVDGGLDQVRSRARIAAQPAASGLPQDGGFRGSEIDSVTQGRDQARYAIIMC